MKYILTILFCCLVLIGVQAQSVLQSDSDLHRSFQTESQRTPYQISLNNNYLFLVDDPIQQVMFNPARATNQENGFVTGQFTGNSSNNFNMAALVPSSSGSWFFNAGGEVETDHSDLRSDDFEQSFRTIEGNSSLRENLEEQFTFRDIDDQSNRSQAEFRLLKVYDSGPNTGRAFGIIGGFSTQENILSRSERNESFERTREFRMDTLYSIATTEREVMIDRMDERINNKIMAGLEFYSWANGSDLSHKLYIQRTDYKRKNQDFTVNGTVLEIMDPAGMSSSSNGYVQERDINSVSNPWQFHYELYKNTYLDKWGDDYLFARLQFVFGFGDQQVGTDIQRTEGSMVNGESESSVVYDYTVNFDNPITNFIGGRLSTGYAITLKADDFSLITGINPYYELSFEGVNRLDGIEKQEVSVTQQQIGGELPAFVMFGVAPNLKVWGGGSFKVNHRGVKTDIEVTPFAESSYFYDG